MPKKQKLTAGDWKDTALDVAKTVGSTALDVAPHLLPLLLGLGRRMKEMDERYTKLEGKFGTLEPMRNDNKKLKNINQTNEHFDEAKHENQMANLQMQRSMNKDNMYAVSVPDELGGSQKLGGVYKIAGSEKLGGIYKIAGSEKLGGKQRKSIKGKSPLADVLSSVGKNKK